MERDTIPPDNCSDPNNTAWEQIYCQATIDSTQASKTRQALDRIAQRGPECAILAQKGLEMLAGNEIRFFVATDATVGYGHRNTGIQIAGHLVENYDLSQPDQVFEHVLVHELDHVFGLGHIDNESWETPHTGSCA